jgi:hypothetical protein
MQTCQTLCSQEIGEGKQKKRERRKNMSKNPRRVQINGEWYDAREGWAGTLIQAALAALKHKRRIKL